MLDVAILSPANLDEAVTIFHRDGFVAIGNALDEGQLAAAQAGAQRVIDEQTAATKLEDANRGFARYSFGDQLHHPEWAMLVDLPTTLPLLEKIWRSTDFTCSGAGGDYSVPGAKIQPLHADIGDFLKDPLGQVTYQDVPTPFIVINFLMVDFTRENGAIRFIPGTQRSRHPVPSLEDEPDWMKNSILCAPAGTAIVRDVRCWHAGTANTSQQIRPMVSAGYFAPWFRAREAKVLPRALHEVMSPRSRELCRHLVND